MRPRRAGRAGRKPSSLHVLRGQRPLRRPWAASKRRHLDSPNSWCGQYRCSPGLTSLFGPAEMPPPPGALFRRPEAQPDNRGGRVGAPRHVAGIARASTVRPRREAGLQPRPGAVRGGGAAGAATPHRPRRRLRAAPGEILVFISPPPRPRRRVRGGAGPGRAPLRGRRCPPPVGLRASEGFSPEADRKGLTAPLPRRAPRAAKAAAALPGSSGKPSPLFSTFPQSSAFK